MKREFGLLTQRKWFSDVQTSAQMTTIAFYNLGGVGYYVGETENAFTCVIVKEKIV